MAAAELPVYFPSLIQYPPSPVSHMRIREGEAPGLRESLAVLVTGYR